MKIPMVHLLLAASLLHVGVALATGAEDVFARAASSVAVLEILDPEGNVSAALTAVVVAPERVVTTCDPIADMQSLRISIDQRHFSARLDKSDNRRNLCLLAVPGLDLTPLKQGANAASLQPGQRVYALSNALGLGIGITEGVLSGIRTFSGSDYLQFTAPVSPGSDGGALLDAQGKLIGVIEYRHRDGQNVNFALPAQLLAGIGREDAAASDYDRWLEQARRLHREENWQALSELGGRWTRQSPNEAEAWQWSALAAQGLNDTVAEESAWQALLRIEPTSGAALAGLVRAQLRLDKGAEALAQARSLVELRQENADYWALLGGAEQRAGTPEQAEQAYRKALTLNPWQIEAYLGLVGLAERSGDRAAVTAVWQRLARLAPGEAKVRNALIQAYLLEDRPQKAFRLLHGIGAAEAETSDVLFLRAATLSALGRPLEALPLYQRSLAGEPGSRAQVQASLGKLFHHLQRYPEAVAALREAVRLDPKNDEWGLHLAISLKDGGHGEEAVKLSQALLQRLPKEPRIWRTLGFAEARLGHYDASIAALERALELDPRQYQAWLALMLDYHSLGRLDDARRAYETLRGFDVEWAEKAYRMVLLPYEATK